MRVVVFTGNAHLRDTPWWRILETTDGIDAVLVCRKVVSGTPRDVFRRFRKNVAHHGLVFIPYRLGFAALSVARLVTRPLTHRRASEMTSRVATRPLAVETIEALDIHSSEVVERVRAFAPDLGLSLGAPILRAPLFRIPPRGTLNLHLGKVPDFRGAPPAFWELVQGATTVGATIHWVDDGLDTGAVVASGEAPIYATDSLADVEARVEELGTRLFREALRAALDGSAQANPQPAGGHSTNRMPTLGQRTRLEWRLFRQRAAARLRPRQLAKPAAMWTAIWVYRPIRDLVRRIARRQPVRVFTFHRVTALCRDGMTISPEAFRAQAEYIARHHRVVSLEEAVALIRGGARLARPVAVLTFDDAYRSVFEAAFPIMASLDMTGCCFVSTDLVATDRRFEHDLTSPVRAYLDVMDWSELATLRSAGWSFGSHTASHARLSACSGSDLEREVREPMRALGERLGVSATVLAYPFGARSDFSGEAEAAARAAGYSTVFANYGGENRTGSPELILHRFDLGGDHAPLAWKSFVHGFDFARWRGLWPS